MKRISYLAAGVVLLLAFLTSACAGPSVSVSEIIVKGSDTMVNLASAWAEDYQASHAAVKITVSGGGSGIGIAALIDGTTDICNNSRPWKDEEILKAKAKGVNPVQTVVARDGVAVVVNPTNPVNELTMEQLSAIYAGNITNWKEVGGNDSSISVLSRDSNSGTHVFFKEHVVQLKDKKAEYGPKVQFLPTSQAIADEVARNPNAIGFYGLGYLSQAQKLLGIKLDPASAAVYPNQSSVKDNSYPISRPLFVTTNDQPSGALRDYLDWVVGPEGQKIVAELEFVPITDE